MTTEFIFIDPRATQAVKQIIAAGRDQIRCSLTGAPYAVIHSDEILFALEGDLEMYPQATVERLVDQWELRHLTLSSNPAPLLRGVTEKALVPLLKRGHDGNVRILVYLLTRLFYPHLGTKPMPSITAQERMEFAANAYDWFKAVDSAKVGNLTQQLIAVDSYCAMPYWHKLWIFESAFSAYSVQNAKPQVRKAFNNPDSILSDEANLSLVIQFLFDLMLYASSNDSTAGRAGNRLAQQLLNVDGRGPVDGIPQHQKTLSQADFDRMAKAKAVNAKQELRVAWSATHGKGVLSKDTTIAERMTRKASFGIEIKSKTSASAPKPKAAKPVSAFDSKIQAAFNSLLVGAPTFEMKKKG